MTDSLLLSHHGAQISVKVRNEDEHAVIGVSRILFINKVSQSHYIEIHYVGLSGEVECVETRAGISDYAEILPPYFFQADRGVIVNLHFLNKYKENYGWIVYGTYSHKFFMTIDVGTKLLELDFG